MTDKDYYNILGISRKANKNEIKRAYKRLAIKYHPDRNKGNKIYENKFKEVKEAYEILIDDKKRSMYDQYGHSAFDQNSYTNSDFTSSSDFSDIFGDVFGDIFGNKKSNKSKKKVGTDILYEIELTLEEAVKGISKKIQVSVIQKCSICNGSGCKPGTKRKLCNVCNGNGNIHMRQGFFTIQQTCPTCNGSGYILNDVCYICRGSGTERSLKNFFIKIPSGVDNKDRIRVVGKGNYGGYGSKCGDLYIKIKIKKHLIFNRDGNNLYCEVPIDFCTATLGGEIKIPYLNNKEIYFRIPEGTQTGRLFRLKNKGIKSIKNNRNGDLLCRIVIETPVNLNKYQKRILNEFKISLLKEKNNPKSKSFFYKIKDFFSYLNS